VSDICASVFATEGIVSSEAFEHPCAPVVKKAATKDRAATALLEGLRILAHDTSEAASRKAAKKLEAVLEAPDWPEAHYACARASMRAGDWTYGMAQFQEALRLARNAKREKEPLFVSAAAFVAKGS
jgi:hypothetical protein